MSPKQQSPPSHLFCLITNTSKKFLNLFSIPKHKLMTSQHFLILLALISSFTSISASADQTIETSVTSPHSLKSWESDQNGLQHEKHIKNVHGILNVIGWGTLMPIGAIVARYFRKQPVFFSDWYPLHKVFQVLGYLLGSIGWSIGISLLGNGSSSRFSSNTHRILGIIIFTLSNLQMLATWIQPKEGCKGRKCWEIGHKVLGYALIGLIVANVFLGLNNDKRVERWKWAYVGLVGVLGCVSVALETFRWIRSKKLHEHYIFDRQ